MSVSLPTLPTGDWVGIVKLFKWAAIGENDGQFFMWGGPNSVINCFLCLEYDKFCCRRKMFSTFTVKR